MSPPTSGTVSAFKGEYSDIQRRKSLHMGNLTLKNGSAVRNIMRSVKLAELMDNHNIPI